MKPKIIYSYHCPYCEEMMVAPITNIWEKKQETWKCPKCKKLFSLKFKEINLKESKK